MADVQMYRFNGSAWVEVNPVPAAHNHPISQITGLQTELNQKENVPYLEIRRNDGGGAKFIKFLEVNYNDTTDTSAVYIKVSMRAGHGNAVAYVFNEDIFIQVSYTGSVIVRSPKYYAVVGLTTPTRYYGDIAYTVDTISKVVKFYVLIGQYTRAYFTPPVRLNSSTGGTITPFVGDYNDDFDSENAIYAPRQWYGIKETDADFIFEGDPRLTNARPASDVYAWAKAASKPSYNLGEISETTTYKRVTQTEKDNWNNKWKEIYTGTSAVLSKTTTTSITVPSDTYAGKTIAVEFR